VLSGIYAEKFLYLLRTRLNGATTSFTRLVRSAGGEDWTTHLQSADKPTRDRIFSTEFSSWSTRLPWI